MSKLDDALKYLAMGFKIQPIHWINDGQCSCGHSDCKTPGKHPLTHAGYKDASAAECQVRIWLNKWPQCNIGLTMGQIVDGKRLIALDIDPRNGGDDGLSELISEKGPLPDTATQLTQSGGLHYLFWAPPEAGFPGLLKPGVEVKYVNHINVYPSVGLSGAYQWEGSADLLDGFPIADAPDWLLEAKAARTSGQVPARAVHVEPGTVAELKEALAFIPADDYHDWIKIGQALKTLGQAGFGLWVNWSQLSKKYNAKAMRPKWNSFKPTDISYQSVFVIAEQHGWVNSARIGQNTLAEIARKANRTPKVAKVQQLTEDLSWPKSCEALAAVSDILQLRGGVRNESTGRAATLAMLSHTAGRRYRTELDDPVHLYQVLCAPSLGEIRHVKTALFELFSSASIGGAKQIELTTTSAIFQKLHESPALLYVAEKFAQHLKQSKRQFSGSQENAFATLSDIYDQTAIRLDKPGEYNIRSDSKNWLTLHSPAISMLALMPDDQTQELLCVSELGRGALEQYLFSFAQPEQTRLSEPQRLDLPEWLKTHLARINDAPIVSEYSDVVIHSEEPVDYITVRFSAKPDAAYADIMSLSDHPLARNLLIGARSQVRRVSALLAIWDNPETPTVNEEHLDWARRVVSHSVREMLNRLKLVITDDGKLSAQQKILSVIHRAGEDGVTHKILMTHCRAYKNMTKDERETLMAQLIEDEDIISAPNSNRKGVRYISSDFAVMVWPDESGDSFSSSSLKGDKGDAKETLFFDASPYENSGAARSG